MYKQKHRQRLQTQAQTHIINASKRKENKKTMENLDVSYENWLVERLEKADRCDYLEEENKRLLNNIKYYENTVIHNNEVIKELHFKLGEKKHV